MEKIFEPFPKIPRLSRECIITEKIDGTNAQVFIFHASELGEDLIPPEVLGGADGLLIMAGSRSRIITPENDNHGFAKWVKANALDLILGLGPGRHFGEWWGQGVNRGYGLKEKRFSLFNTHRWYNAYRAMCEGYDNGFPKCCHVVPVLWTGEFSTTAIECVMKTLNDSGSMAAPGFMNPEGVVVYHKAGNYLFKKTFEKDGVGKGDEG